MTQQYRYGVVGTHVRDSLSPVLQNAAYRALGLDWQYGIFELPEQASDDDLRKAFDAFLVEHAHAGVQGLSVTMPFKTFALKSPHVADLPEDVRAIGAANLLYNPVGGKWYTANTDWQGAVAGLKESGVSIEDQQVLLIGAGGAARAVAYGLLRAGAGVIRIANRTVENAQQLVNDLHHVFPDSRLVAVGLDELQTSNAWLQQTHIVYNASSFGMAHSSTEKASPLSRQLIDALPLGAVVIDAVYMPRETRLLQDARDAGLQTIDGTRMLLHQAAEQVRIMTGYNDVPLQEMETALNQAINVSL